MATGGVLGRATHPGRLSPGGWDRFSGSASGLFSLIKRRGFIKRCLQGAEKSEELFPKPVTPEAARSFQGNCWEQIQATTTEQRVLNLWNSLPQSERCSDDPKVFQGQVHPPLIMARPGRGPSIWALTETPSGSRFSAHTHPAPNSQARRLPRRVSQGGPTAMRSENDWAPEQLREREEDRAAAPLLGVCVGERDVGCFVDSAEPGREAGAEIRRAAGPPPPLPWRSPPSCCRELRGESGEPTRRCGLARTAQSRRSQWVPLSATGRTWPAGARGIGHSPGDLKRRSDEAASRDERARARAGGVFLGTAASFERSRIPQISRLRALRCVGSAA